MPDVDNTVKISRVLNKAGLAETTLLEELKAVPGMPAPYPSLAKSLTSPQFIFVSGSPYYLFPFLRKLIHTAYSASKGPIALREMSNGIRGLSNFAAGGGVQVYKVSMIKRIHRMYPKKKFLMVGDSTQRDPEAYAEAYKTFGGNFVSCIWIREVAGADNTPKRFAVAFEGIPKTKYRGYKNADIPSLRSAKDRCCRKQILVVDDDQYLYSIG